MPHWGREVFFASCQGSHDTLLWGLLDYRFVSTLRSTLFNLDEGYKFLKILGLVMPPPDSKSIDAAAVPDADSEFNNQTGKSALTTKTARTFGCGSTPATNVAGPHPHAWSPLKLARIMSLPRNAS
eukprot:4396679-Amphidinium_carterae.2